MKGKYITFLDVDDKLSPEKLRLQVEIMSSNPNIGFCYSGFKFLNEANGEIKSAYNNKNLKSGYITANLLKNYNVGLLTLMLNKNIMDSNNIKFNDRFNIIGDLKSLPKATVDGLSNGIKLTDSNTGLNLCLAINYGSRQEIIETVQTIPKKVLSKELSINEINEKLISDLLYTSGVPDPDLLIRTSGEYRLSNFLLWQSAYTEIYMTETFWPVFREEELLNAIYNFQLRERRFGKVSSQVKNQ